MQESDKQPKGPDAIVLSSADEKVASVEGVVDPKNIQPITPNKPITPKKTIHLSAKATFIGLSVALVLIIINLVAVFLVLRYRKNTPVVQSGYNNTDLSVEDLQKLNGKTTTIGESFGTLIVSPFATFKNKVQVAKDVSIGGQLNTVGNTTLSGLTAGSTSVSELQVAGKSTLNQATFNAEVNVKGTTTLLSGLNVNNSIALVGTLNVVGNASISGSLTVSTINFKSGVLNGPLSINGHYISGGPGPSLTYNTTTLGSSGTASVSGNDTTGTIVITPGNDAGPGNTCTPTVGTDPNTCGLIATITFGAGYSQTPRINLTPIGREAGQLQYYITRTASGFKLYSANKVIGASVSIPNPQIGFDYFIAQ